MRNLPISLLLHLRSRWNRLAFTPRYLNNQGANLRALSSVAGGQRRFTRLKDWPGAKVHALLLPPRSQHAQTRIYAAAEFLRQPFSCVRAAGAIPLRFHA